MASRRLRRRYSTAGPPEVPAGLWAWLVDGPYEPTGEADGRLLTFTRDERELWFAYRDQVIPWFAFNHPGKRPSHYWQFEPLPPRRRGESEAAFLRRCGLLLPGENP